MDIHDFKAGKQGKGYKYEYFLPNTINKQLFWTDPGLNELLETAARRLGELNAFSRLAPDVSAFIRMHVFKEAVVSSRIEGTQTHIGEALMQKQDVDPERQDDWQEVNNYVEAMDEALIHLPALPLSNRMLRETHFRLMQSVRGATKSPGEFRISQNWIGGSSLADATYIPPAHELVPELMADLEGFIHNDTLKIPHLIKAALLHYQFETIHPFLDGNGRLGRLLITLYLVDKQLLSGPILYLSDFFSRHKSVYYDNLTAVREKNDLRRWLQFFLMAVRDTAGKGIATLQAIIALKQKTEREFIHPMGRRAVNAHRLLEHLFRQPLVTASEVSKELGISPKSTYTLMDQFAKAGLLKEITGMQRGKIYSFEEYIALFESDLIVTGELLL